MNFDEKLINSVEWRSALYDDSVWNPHRTYAKQRIKLWKEVSQEIHVGIERCQKRWVQILLRYLEESNKSKLPSGSRVSTNREWKLMNRLSFLEPFIENRITSSSLIPSKSPVSPKNTSQTILVDADNIDSKSLVSTVENTSHKTQTSLVKPTNSSSKSAVFAVTCSSPRIETVSVEPAKIYCKPTDYGVVSTSINTKTSSTLKPRISVVPITSLIEPSYFKSPIAAVKNTSTKTTISEFYPHPPPFFFNPSFSVVETTPSNVTPKSSVLAVKNTLPRISGVNPTKNYYKPAVYGVENTLNNAKSSTTFKSPASVNPNTSTKTTTLVVKPPTPPFYSKSAVSSAGNTPTTQTRASTQPSTSFRSKSQTDGIKRKKNNKPNEADNFLLIVDPPLRPFYPKPSASPVGNNPTNQAEVSTSGKSQTDDNKREKMNKPNEFDEVDHFLLSLGPTIRRLDMIERLDIQMKIQGLIMGVMKTE